MLLLATFASDQQPTSNGGTICTMQQKTSSLTIGLQPIGVALSARINFWISWRRRSSKYDIRRTAGIYSGTARPDSDRVDRSVGSASAPAAGLGTFGKG